jgi:hypothetical protein
VLLCGIADSCLSASLRRRFPGSPTKATERGPFTSRGLWVLHADDPEPFRSLSGPTRPGWREPDKHELTMPFAGRGGGSCRSPRCGGSRGGGLGRVEQGHGGLRQVAAVGDLPLVVGLDEHARGQPQDRGFAGEDAYDVGATLDLLVQPLQVRVGPGRGASLVAGPFPRAALRTGRARSRASCSPRGRAGGYSTRRQVKRRRSSKMALETPCRK